MNNLNFLCNLFKKEEAMTEIDTNAVPLQDVITSLSTSDSDKVFYAAIEKVLVHEGGYVNNPDDPGGETNFGIAKKDHPDIDIKNLTKDQAIAIYKQQYWDNTVYPQIEDEALAGKMLDLAVNLGTHRANMLLQQVLNAAGRSVTVDGLIGPLTMSALKTCLLEYACTGEPSSDALLCALRSEAAGFYRVLATVYPKDKEFLTGWLKRAYDQE